ncbi:unnamed protein product [Ceutorhynchus assimilis]|uniref:Polyglutamine-binding protein 1 n=1 Tax=Ceutorhynchus assimilis TaxID=467358 RepID=A0A9N9MQK3_9CUCU|nr:unnamed protein product [Ceutorhynchus assimilis]
MPLPAALAAKLAKRGLITSNRPKSSREPVKKLDYKGLSVCPNKSNVFHECNQWCDAHWKGVATPDPKYLRNMQKLLAKYPLALNWTEIFDKGVGRYYYWNMETDLVSWLPPKHPKAILTKSAAKLREWKAQDQRDKRIREESIKMQKSDRDQDRDSDDPERNSRSKHSDRRDHRDRDRRNKRDREDRDRYRRDRDKRKREDNLLDPMDPAAYSDIPQGTWSDGLDTNKSRADNTASGVLFQQRPYPAPGAVLAANKEKDDKEKKK